MEHNDQGERGLAGPGAAVVRVGLLGTLIICAAGACGLASKGLARGLLAPVSGIAAAIGIAGFVWSYLHAVNRSREHEISVSQLYFAVGAVAPRPVKRLLQGCLAAQVGVAIVVMVAGFSQTKPQEFNWAACIIIVPLFGMGVTGVWVARFGSFGPRIMTARGRRTRVSRSSASPERVPGTAGRGQRPLRPRRPGGPTPSNQSGTGDGAAESRNSPTGMEQNGEHG